MTDNSAKSMDDLVALCKRRGFIFPASEIYGGINGFWDYGPLGTELKNNLRDAWWNDMVKSPPAGPDGEPLSIVGVDSAIIQHPKVWEASGHVAGFNDPMIDCRACKSRFRADHIKLIELQFYQWEGEEAVYSLSGVGEPDEVLEQNTKELKKLRKAHGDQYEVRFVRCFTELNEAGRAQVVCPECGRWYPIGSAVETIPEMLPDDLREKERDLEWLERWRGLVPSQTIEGGKPYNLTE